MKNQYLPQRTQRGCSLSGAFNITEQVKDCVMIMHAPAGCAAINISNRFSTAYHRWLKGESMPKGAMVSLINTNLNEQDVIFGGAEALRTAIKDTLSKFSPQLIAIITACVAGVIGDDVRAIVEEIQPQISAKILVIESDGFLAGGFYTGIDNVYYALLEELVEPPKNRYDNRVNILGEKNLSTEADFNFREIQRLINQFGMEVHTRFVRNTTTEQIKRLAEARVNLIRDTDIGLWPAQYLQERFGMEFLDKPFPIGRLATIEWLRAFGAIIDKTDNAEKIIESENSIFARNLKQIGEPVADKTAIVSGTGDFRWLVDIASGLGLKIIQVNIVGKVDDETLKISRFDEVNEICSVCFVVPPRNSPNPPSCPPHKTKSLVSEANRGGKPHSAYGLRENWDEVALEVNKLRPNFCLSTVRLPATEDGIAYASLPIVAPVGFNGALRFAREWVWEIRHPFREGWRMMKQ